MSITPQLRAAARGAYRRLFRAANDTFHGMIARKQSNGID